MTILSLPIKVDTIGRFLLLSSFLCGSAIIHAEQVVKEILEESVAQLPLPQAPEVQQTIEAVVTPAAKPIFYSAAKAKPEPESVVFEDLWAEPELVAAGGPTMENWMDGD